MYANFMADTQTGGIDMTIQIEMIPIKPRGEWSLLYVDGRLYKPQESQKGLREIIEKMFEDLIYKQDSNISRVTAHSSLSNKTPKKICDIAAIDPFYYNDMYGNYLGEHLNTSVLKTVKTVITLVTWLEIKNKKAHFREHVNFLRASRTCVICKTVQEGRIIGRNNIPPCKPIPEWSAKYCLNPDCLSHRINKMIDPDYEVKEIQEKGANGMLLDQWKEMGLPEK